MNCALLKETETCVRADSEDAEHRIKALRDQGIPMTLVVTQPTSPDFVRMAAYDARNTLHVFTKTTPDDWTAQLMSVAVRCGIRVVATIYPIAPGAVRCGDVLEKVASLCVGERMRFLFMFPKVGAPVKRAGQHCTIDGRTVNARHLSRIGASVYPSKDYTRQFMERVHKYLDCTSHTCGMCGQDCAVCTGRDSA